MLLKITVFLFVLLTLPLIVGYSEIILTIRDGLRVKIRFALFSVELSNFKNRKKDKSNNDLALKRRILHNVLGAIESCDVRIREVRIPKFSSENERYITSRYRYNALFSVIIAYFESKAENLTIDDNAFALISDVDETFSLIISFKTKTYKLIHTVLRIWMDSKKSKRNDRYVRE